MKPLQNSELKVQTAKISVLATSSLVVLKLLVGLLMRSVSVVSEALHSGMDLLAASIAFFSVRKSAQPADSTHPFGHGKFESVSGALEALLIFVASIYIIFVSITKMVRKVPVEHPDWGIVVMFLSAAVNFLISQRLFKVSRGTGSIALEADAWHLRTDFYTSLGVLAGLIALRLTDIHLIDPLIAIMVALFIIKAAWDLTKRSLYQLVDTALPADEEEIIQEILNAHYPGFIEFHKLRSRRAGSERHIDLHLVVDSEMHVKEAHELCEHLQQDIVQRFPDAKVIIHIEPPKKSSDL